MSEEPNNPIDRPTEHPLTAYQRDIWTACASFPGVPSFNIAGHLRLVGDVDQDALIEATHRLVARNDVLQMRFGQRAGVPFQFSDPGVSTTVEFVDLTAEPDSRAAAESHMRAINDECIDLLAPGMTRCLVIREAADTYDFFVRSHHALLDAQAMVIVAAQVMTEYGSITGSGEAVEWAPLSIFDHLATEQAYRASEDWQTDIDFWRAHLATAEPSLLPRRHGGRDDDAPAPTGRHSIVVERSLVQQARDTDHSFFSYFFAAVAVHLSRVLGQDEVVLGLPFGNRRGSEKMQLANFANTLPCAIPVDESATFGQLVAATQATVRAAKAHQRLALGDLLRALSRDGRTTRRWFDVAVASNRLPDLATLMPLIDEAAIWPHGQSSVALGIGIRELSHDDDIEVHLDYATDAFDDDFSIERVGEHLSQLIRAAIQTPEARIDSISMLSPTEHAAVVDAPNATAFPFRDGVTLGELIQDRITAQPNAVALIDAAGTPLTYGELGSRANRLARALRGAGVTPGDRVALLAPRSVEAYVGVLAVLLAGGAYVPVDPGYPAERIGYMLEDSGAHVVLTHAPHGSLLAETQTPVIDLRAHRPETDAPVTPAASPDDLAYVIYTSGSTGRPKGVMVEHRSVVNRLAWMQRCHPIGPGDTLLQKTPISFDVSVWELFWWAIEGATLALPAIGAEKDPRELLRAIERDRVSVVHFVPSMLGPFLSLLEADPHSAEAARSLTAVFTSGEALEPRQVEQFRRVFAAAGVEAPRLVNLYGPTEATVDVSWFECPVDDDTPVQTAPIGRPIDNTALYVLGRNGHPQPLGAPGELCIAGVGLARGYLDRPELTAERFVPDTIAGEGRMYRTGDIARWLASGDIEYLGRVDGQVKIRGNRVEVGEVAAAVSAFDGIADAAVTASTDDTRGTYLVAYYVAAEELPDATLRAHLSDVLPAFMIPAYFVRLDALPLSPSGKLDRRALPAPTAAAPQEHVAPRDEMEGALAEVWCAALDLDGVGVHDNWHALGGDSILVLQMVAACEARGLYVEVAQALAHPTIAELAPFVRRSARDAPASPEPFALVSAVDRPTLDEFEDAFPASRMQLGMLFHSRDVVDSTLYHDVFRYTLRLDWNEAAFRRALDVVVARHPALRSSFELGRLSVPMQLVSPDGRPSLAIRDTAGLDESHTESLVQAHIEERRRFDYVFDAAPLWHLEAFVGNADAPVDLVFSFHHAILDGWSVATVVTELLHAYTQEVAGHAAELLPEQLPSPAGYVLKEQEALTSAAAQQFWAEQLEGAVPMSIGGFRGHEPVCAATAISRRVHLPAAVEERVRAFAAGTGVSPKSVLLAAHVLTLRLFTGTTRVTTGVVTHGREERPDADKVAGMFLNALPLSLETYGQTWSEVVSAVASRELEMWPHRRYPLSAIQADLGREVFDTAFNFIHFHNAKDVIAGSAIELLNLRVREETNYGLLVNAAIDPRTDRMWLGFDADGQLVSEAQVDQIAASMMALLDRIVSSPQEPVDFAFLAPAAPSAPIEAPARPERTVIGALLRVMREQPDAIAVAHDGQTWTYADLDAASAQHARALRARGVARGARVGLAVDRSFGAVAALLGIARAGAAVVPLDVTYPAERIAAMLELADPSLVVVGDGHEPLVGDRWSSVSLAALVLDGDAAGHEPIPEPAEADTIYVLFTSGSTGQPKGVAMGHGAFANLIAWQLGTDSGRVHDGGLVRAPHTLQYAPVSFDVSFQELYSTLCGGGTLHLLDESRRRDMTDLLRLLDRDGIERLFLPYVALQGLAQAAATLRRWPATLRILVSSGEQLRVTDEIRALCAGAGIDLLENQYGPTETHVASAFTMRGDAARMPQLPPIGTAIPGAELHVLDAELRPVADGVLGEIFLGGACLAQGYEGRPDLTSERFIADPFGRPGARLYRTGDLGRRLPWGDVVHEGRTDQQVKVNGYRVEPAEVELLVADGQPGIHEVAVIAKARPEQPTESQLVAFLVGDESAVDLDQLSRDLRARAPHYMVPARFVWLDQMPLTPSGKRADAVLHARPLAARPTRQASVAPRTSREREITAMMADVLGVPSVGVTDDFFELGGTSLGAMRLAVMLEQRYGLTVTMSAFAASPTVEGLLESAGDGTAVRPDRGYQPIVAIRSPRRPVFLVHPVGGTVMCYRPVADHLPSDQPLYALQASGLDVGTEPIDSMDAIAQTYADAIVDVQPRGPYTIGGWSLGGLISFAVARCLIERGHEVANLFLIDSMTLRDAQDVDFGEAEMFDIFAWELLLVARGSEAGAVRVPAELTTEEERLAYVRDEAVAIGVLPPEISIDTIRRLYAAFRASWNAAVAYEPEPLAVDAVLLRATDPLPAILRPTHDTVGTLHRDESNGWRELIQGAFEVVPVPGDHLTIMEEPNVRIVADELRRVASRGRRATRRMEVMA